MLGPEAMIRAIYRTLARSCGPQRWWPAETPFEVVVGAILTQNTSWTNVERAMASLRQAGALSVSGIRSLPVPELEQLVRSSGYYRQKAQRLKAFVSFLDEKHEGSLEKMFAMPAPELREQLLALNGIGPETADSMLLYAGNQEIFVVDAYTRRVLERHKAIQPKASYDEVRGLVERALRREKLQAFKRPAPPELRIHQTSPMSAASRTSRTQVYNEMHGLFVQIGKHYCRKNEPRCFACPLRKLLPAEVDGNSNSRAKELVVPRPKNP